MLWALTVCPQHLERRRGRGAGGGRVAGGVSHARPCSEGFLRRPGMLLSLSGSHRAGQFRFCWVQSHGGAGRQPAVSAPPSRTEGLFWHVCVIL